MYVLERLNVVKVVDSEFKKDQLLDLGYALVQEPEVEAEIDESEKALNKMKVTELRDYAAEKGIELGDAEKKAELVEAILAAENQEG